MRGTLVAVGMLLRIAFILLACVLVLALVVAVFRSIFPASTSSAPATTGYSSAAGSAVVTAAAPPQQAAQPPASGPDALAALLGIQWGKDWPGAIATLQQLDQLQPNSQWHAKLYAAYINAGNQQADQGNWTQARSYLNEAIRLDPTRQENTALAARFPAPTPPPVSLAGRVASDFPGTPLTLGETVTSVLDGTAKPYDVYALGLSAGATVQFTVHGCQCRFFLYAPGEPEAAARGQSKEIWEIVLPDSGEMNRSYTAAVGGTYYIRLFTGQPSQRYVLSASAGGGLTPS